MPKKSAYARHYKYNSVPQWTLSMLDIFKKTFLSLIDIPVSKFNELYQRP